MTEPLDEELDPPTQGVKIVQVRPDHAEKAVAELAHVVLANLAGVAWA